MRLIAAIAVSSALACASASSTSPSPTASSGDARASGRCASGMVPAVVERDTDVYAGPDSTSAIVGRLGNSSRVCVDASASGYGFRRVKLPNGRDGFVDEANVSTI
jgi:hypothetical protein